MTQTSNLLFTFLRNRYRIEDTYCVVFTCNYYGSLGGKNRVKKFKSEE